MEQTTTKNDQSPSSSTTARNGEEDCTVQEETTSNHVSPTSLSLAPEQSPTDERTALSYGRCRIEKAKVSGG
eukprot:CAMPEP_0170431128 /NCGR_PEP_ID=MMETSP0117_2-20130122/41234_1 /TAXON_ID=400756 /ORGANISM="Durinskia baltica, Strain CSIRO CS-38" /LENGTH=71 /DNA_ID=CAMNT_0010690659 /DNA_START=88 /DNA_END=300 /DNA_ORIENTATION=-